MAQIDIHSRCLPLGRARGKIQQIFAQIAQSVEQRTENPCVAGSIPALGIRKSSASAEFFSYSDRSPDGVKLSRLCRLAFTSGIHIRPVGLICSAVQITGANGKSAKRRRKVAVQITGVNRKSAKSRSKSCLPITAVKCIISKSRRNACSESL